MFMFTSCAGLIIGAAAGGTAMLGAGLGLTPVVIGASTAVVAFSTETYMDSVEEHTQIAPPPEGGLARLLYELRELGETLIYGAIVATIITILLFRGGRKKAGKLIRSLSGNSAPKKWAVENYERLNMIEEALHLEDRDSNKSKENGLSK